ncbi:ATP-binding protein [Streptomyces tanashiensis]|uniref:AAA family ATPase n=1 Tax=Streptomyces tanashiensis TaxID=67367 RepID=A0ABY6QUI3_9ACTN|nr:AAA family ATPase [Streptomyces tanashiensis]UZX20174.1 AAA family ATPase [Streptomyces tanashiensis]
MARQGDRPTRRGYGLFEREAALDAAEDALDLLTGLADRPAWPERMPTPTRHDRAPAPDRPERMPAQGRFERAPAPSRTERVPAPHRPERVPGPREATSPYLVVVPDPAVPGPRARGEAEAFDGEGPDFPDATDFPDTTDAFDVPDTPGRRRAATRRGGVLAYAAPAGLGKTTLLAEIRRRAAARGCTVLSARGGDQEQRVAFHVARQLLQPQLAQASDTELRERLGSWYDIVGPALGLRAAGEGSPPDPQGLRDGLDWVLTHLAVRRDPLVVVLDDVHWADPESLGWLAAFAPRAEELPMLLVAAYRPDELPDEGREFTGHRSGQRPHGLAPLTSAAVAHLVRDHVGAHADDTFCRDFWTVTSGNPFEAVELAAKVRDRGLEPTARGARELRDLAAALKGSGLVARLERLGTATVRLAWACAVLGTEISPQLAGAVAGLGGEAVADSAARLREARVLAGAEGPDEPLEFVHPLIATTVYRSIPAATRVALHGQAAWCVVDAGLGPTAAARHLLETHPEGDPWVVHQLRAAAGENLRAGAPDAARRCLARALREPPAADDRAAVLFELGCSSLLTEPATTVNHLRAALEEPVADPALRHGIVYRLSQVLAHSDRLVEASELLGREAGRTTDARGRLRMQAEKFMWDAFRADEPESPARSRRLAALADRLTGRDLTERYVIGLRAWDATLRAEPSAVALHHAERALEGGLSWADESRGFEVPVLTALTFLYADRPGRAEELFAAGTAEFEHQGWRGAHLSFAYTLLGYIRHRRGRLVEAEDFVRAGLRLAERVGPRTPAQWYAVGVLIEVLLARGRTEEAAAIARDHDFGEPFPAAVTFPDSQTVHAELLLARGRTEEAAAELAAVGRRLDPRGMRNPAWCPWQLHLALAEAATTPERALRTAEDAVARARQYGAPSAIGQALRVTAEVSEPSARVKLLEESVDLLDQSPAAYELARSLVALGTALRRTERAGEAAEHLYRGLETAQDCGADGLVDEARAELAAAGLRPRVLHTAGTDTLTARERTAAELTVRDRDAAGVLGVDATTLGRVLSSVYRKLGTDRSGLAQALRTIDGPGGQG